MQLLTRLLAKLALIIAICITASSALAVPVGLNIDFRDGTVWGGDGSADFTGGEVTVDANGALLYRDNQDGYGIRGGEWDEIDRQEVLTVWFTDKFFDDPGNWLTGVLLTDLFRAPDGGATGEAGWVSFFDRSGSLTANFFVNAIEDTPNGEHYLDFGANFAPAAVVFTAYLDPEKGYTGSEFSVAGFTTSVPEPGTLALLGFAMLLMALSRRRTSASR